MLFGKKKGPELPEPFAEGAFGSANTEEPPRNPAMPPLLKLDDIKKAVTGPTLKPPLAPPRMDNKAPPSPPPFVQQPKMATQPPTQFQFQPQQPIGRPQAQSPPTTQQPTPFQFQTPPAQQTTATRPQPTPFQFQTPPAQQTNATRPQTQATPFMQPPNQPQRMQPPESRPFNAPVGVPQPQMIKSSTPPAEMQEETELKESPFIPQLFESTNAKKTIFEETSPEDKPEPEITLKKPDKKEKPPTPKVLPPPPPPHAELDETEIEKEEEHTKHKQKKETLVESAQPELLRAFVELVSKNSTVQVVESLHDSELSLAELVEKTGIDENEIKDVVHRMTCLGLIKEFWYKSAAGSHLRKYKLETTKGTIEFDLLALKNTLPIDELKAKSTRLVALITTGGRMPKSVLLKALPVMDDGQLEQVIRYTERFKLPSIRDMLTVESKVSMEFQTSKQEEFSGEDKPPEITDLYYEIENIQKSLGELE